MSTTLLILSTITHFSLRSGLGLVWVERICYGRDICQAVKRRELKLPLQGGRMETFSQGGMYTTSAAQIIRTAECLEKDIIPQGLQILTYELDVGRFGCSQFWDEFNPWLS